MPSVRSSPNNSVVPSACASVTPSVHATNDSPGASVVRSTAKGSPGRSPSAGPVGGSRRTPAGPTTAGGSCPALTYCTSPDSPSTIAKNTVANMFERLWVPAM